MTTLPHSGPFTPVADLLATHAEDAAHFDALPRDRRLAGRPRRTPEGTVSVHVRLDADVVQWLKAAGPGYQTRMNTLLRQVMARDVKAV
jgi:uncharacterized protein (DUF4415 family)